MVTKTEKQIESLEKRAAELKRKAKELKRLARHDRNATPIAFRLTREQLAKAAALPDVVEKKVTVNGLARDAFIRWLDRQPTPAPAPTPKVAPEMENDEKAGA